MVGPLPVAYSFNAETSESKSLILEPPTGSASMK